MAAAAFLAVAMNSPVPFQAEGHCGDAVLKYIDILLYNIHIYIYLRFTLRFSFLSNSAPLVPWDLRF